MGEWLYKSAKNLYRYICLGNQANNVLLPCKMANVLLEICNKMNRNGSVNGASDTHDNKL